MKRYRIGCPGCGSPNPAEIHTGDCRYVRQQIPDEIAIKEHACGEWVRYEDVTDTKQFVEMTTELARMKANFDSLIKKYITHVLDNEGVSFLEDQYREKYSTWVKWDDDEWLLMQEFEARIES